MFCLRPLALPRQVARPNRSHPSLDLGLQHQWRPFSKQPSVGNHWPALLLLTGSQGVISGEFVSRMASLCGRREPGRLSTPGTGCFLFTEELRLTAWCLGPTGSAAADWAKHQVAVNADLLGDEGRVSVDFLAETPHLMGSFGSATRLQFAAASDLLCASLMDPLTPFFASLCG